jgi:voltage-gated potassium channel
MSTEQPVVRNHSNPYNLFILVVTIFSLAVMVLLLLPLDAESKQLLWFYDNAACVIFLIDFVYNITGARPRRAYFIGQRGWLDLLGSIPSFGFFQLTALLRLARLSRLARVGRLLGGKKRKELVHDIVVNRGKYAAFVTILLGGLVLSVSSFLVLQFESRSPDANIVTGGDAIWWGFVTITTVGYGDFYPVTTLGRMTGVLVMFAGVGIIGALASILASILVPDPEPDAVAEAPQDSARPAGDSDVAGELAALRAEVAALRGSLLPRTEESVPVAAGGEPEG